MKQRKPLKRVPIKRNTPLTSGSSLRSSKPSATGETQLKPRRSTGKHVGESKAKRDVKARSAGDCEIRSPWCQGKGREFSHRRAEGQGGAWSATNGMWACGHGGTDGCHGYLHQHPEEARHNGWIVSAWGADPAGVEVLMWHEGRQDWFLLCNEAPWVELAPFPAGDPRHPDDIEVPRPESEMGGAA